MPIIYKIYSVAETGFEPVSLAATLFLATPYCYGRICVVVWTMSSPYLLDLGGGYIVSTHLGLLHLARRCLKESFAELARIHEGISTPSAQIVRERFVCQISTLGY